MRLGSIEELRRLDAADELRAFRDQFHVAEAQIYLDGNSLGALPRATPGRIRDVVEREWGVDLIGSWTAHDWIGAPARVGAKIAALVGAKPNEVLVADSTSVNLFKLIAAAVDAQPGRTKILSELGNFPTDLYMMNGVAGMSGARIELHDRAAIADAIDADTALVVLTHVHYKSAELFDLKGITQRAHECGALILWDLSHSAGAVPVDLNAAGADLAVGCGYKYLNGGPGAPAFLYVTQHLQQRLMSPLSGWMGHAAPFDFADEYRPAPDIKRFLCGTPPVIGLAALEVGVDILLEARMKRIAAKSAALCETFIELVAEYCRGHGLQLIGPPSGTARGSHVSFAHPEAHAIMQALIARGIVGDFRAPDIARFGLTPLYTGFEDIGRAVEALAAVLNHRLWDDDKYRRRGVVT